MNMETKDVKFSLSKMDDEAGRFEGYGSVFAVQDSYNDIVEQGAFKRTLKANDHFPLLWSHDVTQPLGIIRGEEDSKGLKIVGELNLDLQAAQEKRSLIRQGAVKGLSIGYEAVKHVFDDKEQVRRLKEVKLWEISLVVFPANGKSLVSNIKSGADLSSLLETILTMDIKAIEPANREMAQRAIDRIQTLLRGDSSIDTRSQKDPSLEPLIAAVKKFGEQFKI